MLKEFIAGAAAIAAGMIPLAGQASAQPGYAPSGGDDYETGVLNLYNLDLAHNVNVTGGVCDDNINVLGVQVPVQDTLNGLDVPILSPGDSSATGATPENCAYSQNTDGGTYQGD
ncbi:hypothetical protein [Actinophytocola sp.]|uniref:hypothetical protein n=1 Tax=Actinophytocola sp. TaxID=1872138 RepID=UPI00389B12D2